MVNIIVVAKERRQQAEIPEVATSESLFVRKFGQPDLSTYEIFHL